MAASTSTAATELATSLRERTLKPGRARLILIAALATAALVAGSITAVAVNNQAQLAAEQQQAAAAALDVQTISRYTESLVVLQARGQVTLDDAAALAASGSALLTDVELATLTSTAAALEPVLERKISADATVDQVKALYASVLAMVNGAHARFGTFVTAAIAAAGKAFEAGPAADAATRQALVDAQVAFEAAFEGHGSVMETFAALEAAIAAVAASQAQAVALAAAAVAAAASGASTYTYGGQTYHTGAGTGGGGTGGGGGDSGGTPTYTDAQARADVANAYGAQPKGADCDPMNWGTWSAGSTPPPPAMAYIGGGWLGYTAWSIGNGGEVHYWACY